MFVFLFSVLFHWSIWPFCTNILQFFNIVFLIILLSGKVLLEKAFSVHYSVSLLSILFSMALIYLKYTSFISFLLIFPKLACTNSLMI
jgi:hypothetical protein